QKLAYGSYRAFGDAVSAPYTSQYVASRNPEAGWQSHSISPLKTTPITDGAFFNNELQELSGDLCESWWTPYSEPLLAEGAIPGFINLYRQDLCGEGGYEAFTTAKPKSQTSNLYRLELQGHSADGSVAAFAANDSLKGTSAPALGGNNRQLYLKQSGGPLVFACVLPGGANSSGSCSAGTNIA